MARQVLQVERHILEVDKQALWIDRWMDRQVLQVDRQVLQVNKEVLWYEWANKYYECINEYYKWEKSTTSNQRSNTVRPWIISDCNGTRTHNHLVRKWKLNDLAKMLRTMLLWVRVPLQSFKVHANKKFTELKLGKNIFHSFLWQIKRSHKNS